MSTTNKGMHSAELINTIMINHSTRRWSRDLWSRIRPGSLQVDTWITSGGSTDSLPQQFHPYKIIKGNTTEISTPASHAYFVVLGNG